MTSEGKDLGKAIPYGVCNIAGNSGWVSVGITHDTARFAVNAIRQWWQRSVLDKTISSVFSATCPEHCRKILVVT
jgi:hypothetical protein